MLNKKPTFDTSDFDLVTLRLASPERIKEWSFGEITKPETINYRTQRPEKNGLFDEKIFGPERDYECYCGKYRGIRYKGIVCEKCGVEITRSIVRRERMGHIELSSPVAHIWFLRSVPSRIAAILGISSGDAERIVYFAGYIVMRVNNEEKARVLRDLDIEYKTKVKSAKDDKTKARLKELLTTAKTDIDSLVMGRVLDEATYHKFSVKYGTLFEAGVGAEALYQLMQNLDLPKLVKELEAALLKAGSVEKEKLTKRLSLLRGMINAGVRPEWTFMVRIPVTPPALRPMVALEGGRHATSDLNDLYRRVINRNNRLKKLKEINAPEVILRNEKRILQEAVDALIDNSIRHGNTMFSAMSQAQRRPLKSLSDYLKGKQGYFRQNLLGKRVDYSGRSVIVIGPDLKLDQCGLPKHMALELFRPFVIAELLSRELAYNIRGAGRLIEEGIPEVWAILEDVIKDKHVLLNRAPTLHRQGIQAFRPVLIEGNAIQIHPSVCHAFNADFDGDQMAVHVPLSEEAQLEAKEIMSANRNILKPGSGDAVVSAKMLDIALGCYWMTKIVEGEVGEGKYFPSPNAAITAFDYGVVGFRAKIKVMPTEGKEKYAKFDGKVFETSVGRLLFNSVLPSDYAYMNDEIKQRSLTQLIDDLIEKYGIPSIPKILNKIKDFGFKYTTYSGITWSIADLAIPAEKHNIIANSSKKADTIDEEYREGLLSNEEKKRLKIEIWHHAKNEIEKLIPQSLDQNGPIYDMWQSGARGSLGQITQMAGMKGLIANPKGEIIEFPILTSMKEGLSPIEYFVTTHGSRKGLADTALQTAKAGYLTRKLFDVSQDVTISQEDCGTKEGITISRRSASGIEIPFAKTLKGRVTAAEIEVDGKTLFKKGHLISPRDAKNIEASSCQAVAVRSPMTCKNLRGICAACYGSDLTTGEIIDLGEAIGTIAAQAIGEPGTQLTMRTFHTGGTATVGGDITSGLPRVEEVFEKRAPKNPAMISHIAGVVSEIKDDGKEKMIIVLPDAGEKKGKKAIEYPVHFRRMPLVKVGEKVEKGQLLTDGSADISELFRYGGKEKAEEYIIAETNKIYELQGVTISRKHIEVIVRQMFSRRKVKDAGDTPLTPGDVVEEWYLARLNGEVKDRDGKVATADPIILGISEVALSRKSFLSAASFQHTTKTLINAAVRGSIDELHGLKENVIIGRLIPAGTGFAGSKKAKMIEEENRRVAAMRPPEVSRFDVAPREEEVRERP